MLITFHGTGQPKRTFLSEISGYQSIEGCWLVFSNLPHKLQFPAKLIWRSGLLLAKLQSLKKLKCFSKSKRQANLRRLLEKVVPKAIPDITWTTVISFTSNLHQKQMKQCHLGTNYHVSTFRDSSS